MFKSEPSDGTTAAEQKEEASMGQLNIPHLKLRGKTWVSWFKNPLTGGKITNITTGLKSTQATDAVSLSNALDRFKKDKRFHSAAMFQVAAGIHRKAAEIFYAQVLPKDNSWWSAHQTYVNWSHEAEPGVWEDEVITVEEALKRSREIEGKNLLLTQRVAEQQALIDVMNAKLPQVDERKSVQSAFEQWSKELSCKSDREKVFVIRRVRFGIETIAARPITGINLQEVRDSISACLLVPRGPRQAVTTSDHEKSRRIRDMRRFLSWCAEVFNLATIKRVASGLHYSSPQTIARTVEKELLDLNAVKALLATEGKGAFDSEPLAILYRGLVALLVYGGLRLGELAALRWSDVDFEKRELSIRDSDVKQLKTTASNRPIRPLPEIWPHLTRLKSVTGQLDFVVPYEADGKLHNKSWLVEEKGKAIAKLLTRKLIRLESALGLGRKIQQKARRTCRTEMLRRGVPSHVVDLMLGHDGNTGTAHYTHAASVISGFEYAS